MSEQFANWLKRRIEERGLSLRAASTYSGLSPTTIHRLVTEPERTPDPETCHKLAQFFKVDPDYVLAMAGHRIAQVPPERRDYSPEVLQLMDTIASLPPELQVAAVRITRRTIEDLEDVVSQYAEEEEKRLERAGKVA